MELKTKFKILSWAMLFLLIANGTAIYTIAKKHNNFENQQNNCDNYNFGRYRWRHQGPPQNTPGRQGAFRNMIINELDLSPQQIQQFDAIRFNFIENSHIYFDSIRYYSRLIDDELEKENPDKQKINELALNIGQLHTNLKLLYTDYYFDLKNILNDEQKNKLFDVYIKFKQNRSNFQHFQQSQK